MKNCSATGKIGFCSHASFRAKADRFKAFLVIDRQERRRLRIRKARVKTKKERKPGEPIAKIDFTGRRAAANVQSAAERFETENQLHLRALAG